MLKSKSVAKIVQDALNSISKDEQFRIFDSAGDYKGREINGVLKQNKATIVPTINYINANVPYTLELMLPMQCGEDRVDSIVNIVNSAIKVLNGKLKIVDSGKAIFLFDTINMGGLETRATVGQSLILGLSFSVDYSNKDVGTKYEMALIDNEFAGTINTRYFDSQEDQMAWYDTKIETTKAGWNDLLNPNINALVLSSQRYTNDGGEDVNELLMYNYAIIRETKGNTKKYYYYEITNANVTNGNIITLDLKMDTLQTWYFDPNIMFDDCFVSRADLNRFIEVDKNTVRFDTRPESELFEREEIQDVNKRLVSRQVISTNGTTSFDTANNWLNENVAGWYYVYLSSNALLPTGSFSSAKSAVGNTEVANVFKTERLRYGAKWTDNYIEQINLSLYNPLSCVTIPVYKNLTNICLVDDYKEPTVQITLESYTIMEDILKKCAPYIYAIKFSQVSPFKDITDCRVEEDGLMIKSIISESSVWEYVTSPEQDTTTSVRNKTLIPMADEENPDALRVFDVSSSLIEGVYYGLGAINLYLQKNINIEMDYNLDVEFEFKKTNIVGKDHNIKFNPKLLSADYCGLVLSDSLQNGAEYDILKLGKPNLKITYTEALTPDITKKYIRFSDLDGYYVSETADNLTGYVVSDDTSLTLESNAYQSMLANNKNFFLQNSINREEPFKTNLVTSIANTVSGTAISAMTGLIAGGAVGGIVGGVVSAGVGLGSSIYSASRSKELSKVNETLNVDNLKNAPNSISGARGNVIFNAMYSDVGVVVEKHEIIPNEKKIVDDRINLYGMTVNKVSNIKNYENLRKYHNYIEANIEGIKGVSISNAIRDDIRQRFANGVRFWNKINGDFVISYEKENYERWLEG